MLWKLLTTLVLWRGRALWNGGSHALRPRNDELESIATLAKRRKFKVLPLPPIRCTELAAQRFFVRIFRISEILAALLNWKKCELTAGECRIVRDFSKKGNQQGKGQNPPKFLRFLFLPGTAYWCLEMANLLVLTLVFVKLWPWDWPRRALTYWLEQQNRFQLQIKSSASNALELSCLWVP